MWEREREISTHPNTNIQQLGPRVYCQISRPIIRLSICVCNFRAFSQFPPDSEIWFHSRPFPYFLGKIAFFVFLPADMFQVSREKIPSKCVDGYILIYRLEAYLLSLFRIPLRFLQWVWLSIYISMFCSVYSVLLSHTFQGTQLLFSHFLRIRSLSPLLPLDAIVSIWSQLLSLNPVGFNPLD